MSSSSATTSSTTPSSTASPSAAASTTAPRNNKRYRKDKPWDTDDIDHWAPIPVTPDTPLPPPLEESSFSVLFPRYREKYLREVWPALTSTLKAYGIACALDLVEGSMTVRTTRKCWDVSMIVKARDVLKLLSRSLPLHQAVRVLQDEVYCDVVKIKHLVRNKERFVKRRQRLIGPNGCTLKAVELVTDCYVLVQGNTVSCIGALKGVKAVRRIVEDCMRNVHPIYHIKLLMMKQQLAQDPQLREESWDRFLPSFKKRSVASKKRAPLPDERGRVAALFPPPPTKRKVDELMESGEYFLSQEQKADLDAREQRRRREDKAEAKRKEREKDFVPPEEGKAQEVGRKKRKREAEVEGEAARTEQQVGVTEAELSALKAQLKKGKKTNGDATGDASRFFIGGRREDAEGEQQPAVDSAVVKRTRKGKKNGTSGEH